MTRKEVIRALLTLVFTYVILLITFTYFGSWYAKLFLPLFRWEIERFPGFKVESTEFEKHLGEHTIAMKVRVTRNNRQGYPMSFVRTQGWHPMHQYLHAILLVSILAAWPRISLKNRLKIFCLALPLLVLIEMVDIPLRVVSRCLETFANFSRNPSASSALASYWVDFMDSGGRQFLPLVAACLAVGVFNLGRIMRMPTPQPKDLCPCGSGKRYKRCCMVRQSHSG